jgi:putative ABC transport system substrate-binding protein
LLAPGRPLRFARAIFFPAAQAHSAILWALAQKPRAGAGHQMRRREFITFLGGVAAWPLAARAQQAKIWRIGMLDTAQRELNAANMNAFLQGLRDLGYAEGQNLAIDYRTASDHSELLPGLVSELLRLKVDVFAVRGTPEALAIKKATTTVPVVMTAVADPVGAGIVASLAHPGGNFTGVVSFATELAGKRIEILRELIPTAKLVAAIEDPENPANTIQWGVIRDAARTLGVEALKLEVRNAEDVIRVFDEASRQRVDAIYVDVNSVTRANQRLIVDLAGRHRLPAIYSDREFLDGGGLITYGVSYPQLYYRAASFVNKILMGAKPENLPVEQPSRLEVVVNLKTAKALGLTVPLPLLTRADEVIE